MKRTIPTLGILALFGAGCAVWPVAPAGSEQPTDNAAASSTSGESATSTAEEVSLLWKRTGTPVGAVFEAPKGYWVYSFEARQMQYLVPGTLPADGPDPGPSVAINAVAFFGELQNDPASFPTWERFVLTMAQFACASGSSEADFVTCSDKAIKQSHATSTGGLPYWEFSLPASIKKTGASRGVNTFIALHMGPNSQRGLLFTVLNPNALASVRALVQSMRLPE